LKIANIEFSSYPVFLAPMEDVTEPSFRYMCKKFGADLLYTEFVSSDALIRSVNKSVKKLRIFDYERPIAIQIFGKDVESMVQAALIAEEEDPDIIDINFGCPVKKIASKGSGAGMLKFPDKMLQITSEIVKAVKKPVTVKTRLGWDDDSKIICDLAEKLQDTGISALTIHGRTRAQMYSGEADWSLIAEVKSNPRMKIPIIGNGDIDSPEKALQMFKNSGVDAIMVGRAAIGNPYIFSRIKNYLNNSVLEPELSVEAQVKVLIEFTKKSIEFKGLPGGVIHMRRHYAKAFKGLPNISEKRIELLRATDFERILEIFEQILNYSQVKN